MDARLLGHDVARSSLADIICQFIFAHSPEIRTQTMLDLLFLKAPGSYIAHSVHFFSIVIVQKLHAKKHKMRQDISLYSVV